MIRFSRFVISLFLLSQICGVTMAQDSLNVRLLGEAHDFVERAYDVAMAGNYAYLSSGFASGLRVLDLSDPSAPVEVGYAINNDRCPGLLTWMSDRVRVSGDRAYVLYFDGTWSFAHYRLYVYDVSDPGAPQQMGYLSLPDNCTSQFVAGDYVYVTAFEDVGLSEVMVIDVSDPTHPLEVGCCGTPGMAQEVYLTDNRAYVADNDSLIIFDVTDPCSPKRLGSYAPPGAMALIHHVAAQGDYAYIADATFGVRVLDVSDFSQIEEVGSVPHNQPGVNYSRLRVSGDLIYYMQDGDLSDKQLVILDVSDPKAPAEIGWHDMPGSWWFYGFEYLERYACVAGGKAGLRVVEIAAPDSFIDVCTYDPYDLTSGLAVSGDYAFVGTYLTDLVVYDVSDPSLPKEVTALEFPDSPIKQMSAWGEHLYVPAVMVDGDAGVSVLDITDPANPHEIAYWPPPPGFSGAPFNVERYGDYAFVACALGGVEIYDVAQIDQPIPLDNWTLWDPMTNPGFGVTNVKVSWPYLFAPDRAFGLYVLDVSDPSDIVEVASCETPGEAMWADISADHHHVYIADADGGLRVINVMNPLAPVEVGSCEANLEMANHVAVCGDTVYVTDAEATGLHVFDVSDPRAPVEVGYHETPGALAHNVTVADGLIYLLDFTHFEIFETTCGPAGVDDNRPGAITSGCKIRSVYPNPFDAGTKVIFDLAEAGHVRLRIYNSRGQRVHTLADGHYQSGRHACIFRTDKLASGVYVLRLDANGVVDTRKLILMR